MNTTDPKTASASGTPPSIRSGEPPYPRTHRKKTFSRPFVRNKREFRGFESARRIKFYVGDSEFVYYEHSTSLNIRGVKLSVYNQVFTFAHVKYVFRVFHNANVNTRRVNISVVKILLCVAYFSVIIRRMKYLRCEHVTGFYLSILFSVRFPRQFLVL